MQTIRDVFGSITIATLFITMSGLGFAWGHGAGDKRPGWKGPAKGRTQRAERRNRTKYILPVGDKTYTVERAISLENEGKRKEAIQLLQKIIERWPKSHSPHMILGSLYLNSMQYEKAILFFKKAAKLKPKYAPTHYALGMLYEKLKDHKKAIKSWKRYLLIKEVDPESLEIAKKHLEHEKQHLAKHTDKKNGGQK